MTNSTIKLNSGFAHISVYLFNEVVFEWLAMVEHSKIVGLVFQLEKLSSYKTWEVFKAQKAVSLQLK